MALAGCAAPAARPPATGLVGDYELGCNDVVRVELADRPAWDCVASVGLDGTLPLGELGEAVAAGGTLSELHAECARLAAVPPHRLTVTLAAARAGRVYLVGPENRLTRALPYVGPERVSAFLSRASALPPGCSEPRGVTVTRRAVAGGLPEFVWKVDVAAIARGDASTDLVIEPSDVVEVGETRRSRFARGLPDWARPGFRALAGLGTCPDAAIGEPIDSPAAPPAAESLR